MQVNSAVQSHLLLLSGIGLPTSLLWLARREEPSRGSSGVSPRGGGGGFDLFPRTGHMERVAQMVLAEEGRPSLL
jgi:hypothetical protein